MFKKIHIIALSFTVLIFPVLVSAQTNKKLSDIIDIIISYANRILVLMMGVAVVFFVWYVIKYYIRPNENRTDAGLYVMYSLIGFFVILSMWGLVNILQNTFGIGNRENVPGSWSQFTNIFPGGGSTRTNNVDYNSGRSTRTNNVEYDSGESGITPDTFHQ